MDIQQFITLPKGDQFNLLIDPTFQRGDIEVYFRKSDLSIEQLIQVFKVNAKTRIGGDNSYRRMIYFILSLVDSEIVDPKALAEYAVTSQSEYAKRRKECLEVFLK